MSKFILTFTICFAALLKKNEANNCFEYTKNISVIKMNHINPLILLESGFYLGMFVFSMPTLFQYCINRKSQWNMI